MICENHSVPENQSFKPWFTVISDLGAKCLKKSNFNVLSRDASTEVQSWWCENRAASHAQCLSSVIWDNQVMVFRNAAFPGRTWKKLTWDEYRQPTYHMRNLVELPTLLPSLVKYCSINNCGRQWGRAGFEAGRGRKGNRCLGNAAQTRLVSRVGRTVAYGGKPAGPVAEGCPATWSPESCPPPPQHQMTETFS